MLPRVAVCVVSYNHARFLSRLFASLEKVSYPRARWQLFFLENASSDNAASLIRETFLAPDEKTTRDGVPCFFLASEKNLGFAGGNNLLIRRAFKEGYDAVYLLNPDTEVAPTFLDEAVKELEDADVGAVQSLLLLGQDPSLVNSAGNAFHFLGFSFCEGNGARLDTMRPMPRDIMLASGAGVLFRRAALEKVGLLDETLFAYHEDVDISLRLRLAGWQIVLAPPSIVYHFYEFSRSMKKYELMERNRFIVLLTIFRWRFLLLTFPMHLAMEAGLWVFAFKSGWWREKGCATGWFFSPANLRGILRTRAEVQKTRVVSDRDLARRMVATIGYQEIDNVLLRRFGNPLMRAYWNVVKRLV